MFPNLQRYLTGGLALLAVFFLLTTVALKRSVKELENEKLVLAAKLEGAKKQVESDNGVISEMSRRFEAQVKQTRSDADKQWGEMLSQKDAEISKLSSLQRQKGSELATLQGMLQRSASPEEKALLQEKIIELVAQLDQAKQQQESLQCLTMPVPASTIASVNAFIPPR